MPDDPDSGLFEKDVLAMRRPSQSSNTFRSYCRRICGVLPIVIVGVFLSPVCHSFELPNNDPWYYQSNEVGYQFMVPDKAQHYWGSAFLNEVGKRLPLPQRRITSPALALTIGFFYEVWQESRGIGFSPRDLIADALGVASSHLNSGTVSMWLDYSVSQKTIMINLTRQL